MARTRTEGGTEDANYLRLKQLGKDVHVKISDKPLDLEGWPGRVSLFSVNNKFAYFAAGCKNAFIVSPVQSLRDHYGSDALYEPQYLNTLSSPPVILKFTSDGERLIVGTRDGRMSVYSTPRNSPDWAAASSSNAARLPLLHEFAHSTEPIRDIQSNPHDRPEIVAALRGSSDGSSVVELLDTSNYSVQQSIRGGPGAQYQTAISWSPKGKRLVVGDRSGQLIQYGLDGGVKASIPAPDAGQAREVVSVAWLENSIFVVAYRSPEDGEELSLFVINHDSKTGTTSEVTLEDPSPPYGMDSREHAHTFVHLRSWEPMKHLLFVSDAPSDEVGVVAYLEDGNPRWAKLDLDETARASAPLAEDGSPSSIVGMDLDLTSTVPIKSDSPDEEPAPASPILLAYSSEGTVLAYHVLNTTTPTYPNMMPYDPSRVGAPAPSPQPNVAPVPAASTARTPAAPTLLPFGAVSGSAAKPTFGFGSSVPSFGSTAFGSTTPTVTPNKPAFGQPAFGATTTPTFGTPNFGATTTPTAFGKPVFGQTSFRAAPAAPAFAGFGAASQKSALGRSGFGSGSGISTTSVQTPPIAGATGTRNHASRLAVSRAPGLESPSSTSPSTPQPNFGSTGFGAFNPVSTTPTTTPNPFVVVAAAQPKKSLAILPSSGAFGQTSGTTSAFGSFGNAAKPAAFSLDKPDGPSASTATPTFGATTSLGTAGFGAHSAPEQSSSVQPVKVGTGGGFAGFGGSGGFGGFGSVAAKAGTQNIFGGTTPTPPAIKIEPSTSPKTAFLFGNGSKAFAPQSGFGASRGQQDTANEEEDQERKERFPESENDNKEPTQTNLDFFAPPQSRSGSEGASSSKFSLMSLGTARPESQATTPGIQTVFVPATPSKSPQSAIPMSTTTTLFPGPPNPSGPSPVRTPMQEERPISPANNQEEVGEEAKKEDTTEPSASPKTAFLFGNGTPKLPARESLFTGEANKEWRHPKFFLSDFVDIQVESMLYRVPGALMQQSEIFKSSLPTSESSSSLYVNEITTQEMETFLDVADARLVIGDDQFTFEQWAGALATANRLGTRRIRDYIVQRLEGHLNRLDPFDCIDVATKYRVHEWLFQPFIRICERQEPLSPAEVLRLGSERTSAVCRVREQLLAHKYDSAITWVGNQWPKDRNFSPPPPLEPPQWEAMATTLEAARVDEVKRLVELETVLSKPDFQSPGSPPTVDIVPQGVAHPKYWQTDLRTIRVRNCLYRLPIRYFEQPGLLRNIRNNEDSPLESGDFVILPHDVIVSDWNIFLDILTARPFDEPPLSLGFSSWMTGLRLSIRFRQESVQRYVLQRIQTDFPEQDPIDLLEAAKMGDADHSNWLQSLYNSLSQRKGSLSPEEIHRIGEKATAEVCRLRDQYMWDAGRRGALNVF